MTWGMREFYYPELLLPLRGHESFLFPSGFRFLFELLSDRSLAAVLLPVNFVFTFLKIEIYIYIYIDIITLK